VAGIFAPGQLVKLVHWHAADCELNNIPGQVTNSQVRVIGRLRHKDIAIIVALERADGRNLYVLGPDGGGWIPGGVIQAVV